MHQIIRATLIESIVVSNLFVFVSKASFYQRYRFNLFYQYCGCLLAIYTLLIIDYFALFIKFIVSNCFVRDFCFMNLKFF